MNKIKHLKLEGASSLKIFLAINPKLWIIKIGKRYQIFSFEANNHHEIYKTDLTNYICQSLKAKYASDIEIEKGILFSNEHDFRLMVEQLTDVLVLNKRIETEFLYIG